ncbi:hypothetical protein DUI87_12946 [Hirundo rustica rustica]|uniref:Uncharacterized protein n=1 Tax=Hirundo rustica rustica TaxID=333673 RepID=A0A3M0KSN0_HIRRU|nr:hypothetical protein DUI87_12946 [Hirundo rustica rustica]
MLPSRGNREKSVLSVPNQCFSSFGAQDGIGEMKVTKEIHYILDEEKLEKNKITIQQADDDDEIKVFNMACS